MLEGVQKEQRADCQKRSVRQFTFPVKEPVGQGEDDTEQWCDEEDRQRLLPSQEAADGGHQGHVTEPHRLLF